MSLFACCVRRNNRQTDELRQQMLAKEPPEISWENSLGSPDGVPFDDDTKELLRRCLDVSVPPPTSLSELVKRSDAFPIKFPVNTMRCAALKDRGINPEIIELNANSAYPLIHEAMLPLVARWLKHKRLYGSSAEKALYRDMSLVHFIHRLLDKRAVFFYSSDDRWKLVDNKVGVDGWENVGTEKEKEPLVLTKCLSYDEIKLSAMMVVSSHTEFINDGARKNRGVVSSDPDAVQPRGVIMGVVGTRFEKPRVMEYQDILTTPSQNNADNGYGPAVAGTAEEKRGIRVLWAKFYGEDYQPLYEEIVKRIKAKDNRRYLSLASQTVFDIENYMKRTLLTVEIILLEANTRAEKQNTTAFLHVVGFGLGVWKIVQDQEVYFLKTFEIAIRKMNKKLKYVSDIMFAYFRQQKCGGAGNGDYLGDIKIHFALREPHSRLYRANDANKLLVVTYAWDGNSLPAKKSSDYQNTDISTTQNTSSRSECNISSQDVILLRHSGTHLQQYQSQPERFSPAGNSGLRRPSRSPRSQRSRSADVDSLKKYTERRVEERRYTEINDAGKLDTSKWMPLPRNLPRGQQVSPGKRPSRDERQDSVDESATDIERWPTRPSLTIVPSEDHRSSIARIDHEPMVPRPPGSRSHSTDVTALRGPDKRSIEQRRHTDCSDPRTIATRWVPQINDTKFRRESSPLARVDCEVTKSSANRWMTFAKNPSPDPVQIVDSEKRDSITERSKKDEGPCKDPDNSKWQPPRKFSPAKGEKGHLQRQDEVDMSRDRSLSCVDANDRANKLNQRMRELYDFKTENEWPKRAGSSQQDNTWISKSSSEEERANYPAVRRNSQDLEFNDRMSGFKSKAEREEERRRQQDSQDSGDVFMDEKDQRLRKFNDKLRYSEDLGAVRVRGRQRRTYSDDYDEKARRESRMSRQSESLMFKRDRPQTPARRIDRENKRNADASARLRDPRVSYVEVDFSKRETRTSDASYANVNFSKQGSVECKSTRKILEAPPRRCFSQSDERPATPVPPIEWNDEHFVPKKLPSERQKRDSTRYKVYLT